MSINQNIYSEFYLEEGMTFLNNGSFGAAPRTVRAMQEEIRLQFERQPVRFVQRELPELLRSAASTLGDFIGARGEDIAFVENASTGINAVVRSMIPFLKMGDEILTTNHVYGAVRQTLIYAAECTGAKLIEIDVPFPIESPEQVIMAFKTAISENTKFAVLDHITSPTGIIYPIENLVAVCKQYEIAVLVDGAHAPGMVELNLDSLGADWYTGNCHKWLFAPKGSAFLWTLPDHQAITHPTVISHKYKMGYTEEFDWTGTQDFSSFLSIPAAIDFYNNHGGANIRTKNRALTLEARNIIAAAWNKPYPAPDEMLGFMAAIEAPVETAGTPEEAVKLHDWLWDNHRIEVPVMPFDGKLWIRISAQIYNKREDYEILAGVFDKKGL
ncbi:MAG: aminotransferase class V-fold PLP-dependent enzyme [Ignavibacteriae bacterium]|nr:aminotransferase class V-fold PLP-dependent enzyme [Ignavibacteriota bacterium]